MFFNASTGKKEEQPQTVRLVSNNYLIQRTAEHSARILTVQ